MDKKLFQKVTDWQSKTFGESTAHSKACHLREEVEELIEALEQGYEERIKEEFADCFFLLYGAAKAHGMTYEEIGRAIEEKLKINKTRKWDKPDPNGVVKHVRV
jgi:NTP pyrophosphatase (non-canonical NTP hydrolase)